MLRLDALPADDVELIGACLDAAVTGPFFPDWEFETLFGLSRSQVKAVSQRWPANAAEDTTEIAVRNTLANLSGYPYGQHELLRNMLATSPERIRQLLDAVVGPE
jgi:hypothetical protein